MFRLLYCTSIVALLLGLPIGETARADVTVRFVPDNLTVDLGEEFTVDIVADIPDPVVAWGLDLSIGDGSVLSTWPDNAMLALPGIGPVWVDPEYSPDGDRLGGVAFPNSVTGTGVLLATVTFSADSLGETDLLLGDDNPFPHEAPPNDLTEGFGLDPEGFADVTFVAGHVEVIPEPATLSLLALGSLTMMRRRRPARLR